MLKKKFGVHMASNTLSKQKSIDSNSYFSIVCCDSVSLSFRAKVYALAHSLNRLCLKNNDILISIYFFLFYRPDLNCEMCFRSVGSMNRNGKIHHRKIKSHDRQLASHSTKCQSSPCLIVLIIYCPCYF